MGLGKIYLTAYSAAQSAGWACVLFLIVQALSKGGDVYAASNGLLKIIQTAAVMEVVHSLVGLVRSPWFPTLVQVTSRVAVLWIFTHLGGSVPQQHWSYTLMTISWCMVEIPRYAFYAVNMHTDKVPYPLFWLRYSLFSILYPTGITGELGQLFTAFTVFKTAIPDIRLFCYLALACYVPGSPFMYFFMVKTRKSAFRKRADAGKPKPVPTGLLFPVTDAKKGVRGSTDTNKAVWEASVRGVKPALADKIKKAKNWRFGYNEYVVSNVVTSCESPETALAVARAGLAFAEETFQFVRDGESVSLAQALDGRFKGSFETGVIKGKGKLSKDQELEIPYGNTTLKGKALLDQLDKWAEYGTIEPSCRDAIKHIAQNPGTLDLSDKYFVLLGAGSAMGPLLMLLALGANVIAVDLDRAGIWKRLLTLAEESPGTMYFPVSKPQKGLTGDDLYSASGCNLFTQTPEILNWLRGVVPGKRLAIGGYAYLDGALHVQLSMAMTSIMKGVCETRKDTALAFLCTPTDVHVIPGVCRKAMQEAVTKAPFWQPLLGGSPNAIAIAPNGLAVVNGIVVRQGPNYALAKRLQHWRAIVARSEGHTVSSNVAPSTSTISVTSNKMFAIGYEGMYAFPPMEIFHQATSNAVMGTLLLHDLVNAKAFASPKTALTNPLELFGKDGAFHGGVWRMAYTIESIGMPSFVVGLLKMHGMAIGAIGAAFGALAYNGLPFDLP